jgi:hypothetical protein
MCVRRYVRHPLPYGCGKTLAFAHPSRVLSFMAIFVQWGSVGWTLGRMHADLYRNAVPQRRGLYR